MKIKVAVAGGTGSVGGAVVRALSNSTEFELVSVFARKSAGLRLAQVLNISNNEIVVSKSIEEVIKAKPDVLIDYTHSSVVFEHCKLALESGVHVVVGTSGLNKEQLKELGQIATKHQVGIFSAGNFSLTAAVLNHVSTIAAKFLPTWEIIDYGQPKYDHTPSNTARDLSDSLVEVKTPKSYVSPSDVHGLKEARGATLSGTQIHSIRSPGYGFSIEAIFGLPGERLVIRHDASESPEPYVHGTLMAAKFVCSFVGLKRGIESLLLETER